MPGELIPIILFIALGVVGVAWSPIGQGIGRMMTGGKDPRLEGELEALRAEIETLRAEVEERDARLAGQIEEASGRLDFAERLLAQQQKQNVLPGQR